MSHQKSKQAKNEKRETIRREDDKELAIFCDKPIGQLVQEIFDFIITRLDELSKHNNPQGDYATLKATLSKDLTTLVSQVQKTSTYVTDQQTTWAQVKEWWEKRSPIIRLLHKCGVYSQIGLIITLLVSIGLYTRGMWNTAHESNLNNMAVSQYITRIQELERRINRQEAQLKYIGIQAESTKAVLQAWAGSKNPKTGKVDK